MNADTNRPKMSAPTPETDNLARGNHVVPTEWAEQLERERDEAWEEIKNLQGAYDDATNYYARIIELIDDRDEAREKYTALATENMLAVNKIAEERDEAREDLEFRRGLYRVQEECLENAREQIKELIYIAERAIALAEIDFENDKFGIVSELRSDLAKIKKSK